MRCDKCHIKFRENSSPSESWPNYVITEKTSPFASGDSQINLCGHCSWLFYKWLLTKPEDLAKEEYYETDTAGNSDR